MQIDKTKSISFTGYRTEKILTTSKDSDILIEIDKWLYLVIKQLYAAGYDTFLSGMANGFDMIAARTILKIKEEYSDIKLVAVIPFLGQEKRYLKEDKDEYKRILGSVDKVVITSEHYHKGVFLIRNNFLLDNCSKMVCYYDGQKGGTMYTYNRALDRDIPLINFCDFKQETIHSCRKNDIEKVMDIWLRTNISAHNFIPESYWQDNYSLVRNNYLPSSKSYIYKQNGLIIAFISIVDNFFIGALFVDDRYQSMGVGRKLLDYCKEKYSSLNLSVYADNIRAVQFYKKCDFTIIDEQMNVDSGYKEYTMSWKKDPLHLLF